MVNAGQAPQGPVEPFCLAIVVTGVLVAGTAMALQILWLVALLIALFLLWRVSSHTS